MWTCFSEDVNDMDMFYGQTIESKGYFAEGVLGIFKIIRGFTDKRNLIDVFCSI